MKHQYIDRETREVRTETLKGDPVVNAIYSSVRENAGIVFNMLVSPRMTALIGAVSYDLPFQRPPKSPDHFLAVHGIEHDGHGVADLKHIGSTQRDLAHLGGIGQP